MPEPRENDADGLPADEELQEPSTEKEPGDEPEAARPREPEPNHEAVGIGVVDEAPDEDGSTAD